MCLPHQRQAWAWETWHRVPAWVTNVIFTIMDNGLAVGQILFKENFWYFFSGDKLLSVEKKKVSRRELSFSSAFTSDCQWLLESVSLHKKYQVSKWYATWRSVILLLMFTSLVSHVSVSSFTLCSDRSPQHIFIGQILNAAFIQRLFLIFYVDDFTHIYVPLPLIVNESLHAPSHWGRHEDNV